MFKVFRAASLQTVLMTLLFLAALFLAPRAQALGTITGLRVQNGVVTVQFADNPGVYYLLEYSPDLILLNFTEP